MLLLLYVNIFSVVSITFSHGRKCRGSLQLPGGSVGSPATGGLAATDTCIIYIYIIIYKYLRYSFMIGRCMSTLGALFSAKPSPGATKICPRPGSALFAMRPAEHVWLVTQAKPRNTHTHTDIYIYISNVFFVCKWYMGYIYICK